MSALELFYNLTLVCIFILGGALIVCALIGLLFLFNWIYLQFGILVSVVCFFALCTMVATMTMAAAMLGAGKFGR
jgi:hypothetical protein